MQTRDHGEWEQGWQLMDGQQSRRDTAAWVRVFIPEMGKRGWSWDISGGLEGLDWVPKEWSRLWGQISRHLKSLSLTFTLREPSW